MKKLLATLFCIGLLVSNAEATSYFPPLDPPSYLYTHITTATTTLVKTGPGSLRAICVNTVVASGTVTADDAITATTPTISIMTSPSTITGDNPYCVFPNASFTNGLTIVTTGAQDVSVYYQ